MHLCWLLLSDSPTCSLVLATWIYSLQWVLHSCVGLQVAANVLNRWLHKSRFISYVSRWNWFCSPGSRADSPQLDWSQCLTWEVIHFWQSHTRILKEDMFIRTYLKIHNDECFCMHDYDQRLQPILISPKVHRSCSLIGGTRYLQILNFGPNCHYMNLSGKSDGFSKSGVPNKAETITMTY